MKTYSKRIKSEDIENCRLCLNMMENGLDIFESRVMCIEELLSSSLNITVSKNDGLPSKICKACYDFLIKLSLFKAQCKSADEWLRENSSTSSKPSEADMSSLCSDTQIIIKDLQNASYVIDKEIKETNNANVMDNKELDSTTPSSTQMKKEIQENILNEWDDVNVEYDMYKPHLTSCEQDRSLILEKPTVSTYQEKAQKGCNILEEKKNKFSRSCPICKKAFTFRHSMLRHLNLHSGEKKYECDICNAKFSQLVVLKRHALRHNNSKPWSCDVCGKEFIQKSNLNSHKRIHLENDALKFPCDLCDKVFKFASGRSRHILQHKGVRYSCTICSKVMNDLSSFTRHKKRHVEEKK